MEYTISGRTVVLFNAFYRCLYCMFAGETSLKIMLTCVFMCGAVKCICRWNFRMLGSRKIPPQSCFGGEIHAISKAKVFQAHED